MSTSRSVLLALLLPFLGACNRGPAGPSGSAVPESGGGDVVVAEVAPAAEAAADDDAAPGDGASSADAAAADVPPLEWPDQYPRPAGLASSGIERNGRGDLLLSFTLGEDATLESAWDAWLVALRASGREVLAEHGGMRAGKHAASLGAPNGAGRPCWTVMAQWQGAPVQAALGEGAPAADRPPPALDVACVPIPEPEFRILIHPDISGRWREMDLPEPRDVQWTFRTAYDVDFDGDGTLDALVPLTEGAHCPDDVTHELYLVRGTCGVPSGRFHGPLDFAELRKAAPGPHGLPDVTVRFEDRSHSPQSFGALDVTRIRRVYRFDGRRYGEPEVEEIAGGRMTCSPGPCGITSCTGAIDLLPDGGSHAMLELPERLYGEALERGKVTVAPAVRACTGDRESLAATLTIDGRNGRVTAVEFYEDDRLPAEVRACVRRAVRGVTFDRFARPEMQVSLTWLAAEPPAVEDGGLPAVSVPGTDRDAGVDP